MSAAILCGFAEYCLVGIEVLFPPLFCTVERDHEKVILSVYILRGGYRHSPNVIVVISPGFYTAHRGPKEAIPRVSSADTHDLLPVVRNFHRFTISLVEDVYWTDGAAVVGY